jgi:hypothetical protein
MSFKQALRNASRYWLEQFSSNESGDLRDVVAPGDPDHLG